MTRASDPPAGSWLRRHLAAVAGYLALTTIVLWPAVAHFRTRALSEASGDSAVFMWAWWAMPRAMGSGHNPFRTELLFHPVGADIALSTTTPIVALLTWPVRAALGPVAQVNLVQLAAFLMAALGAYALTHHVVRHRGAAFIAGAVFAAAPYRFVQLPGHFNLIHTGFVPVGLLVFLLLAERPSGRRAAALGGIVGVAFLVDPQVCILLVVGLVPLAVVHRRSFRLHGRVGVIAVAVAVLVAAPLLVPVGSAVAGGELGPPPSAEEAVGYSATPASWVVYPASHPLFGAFAERRPPARTLEATAAPGLAMLVLAVVGRRWVRRERRQGWVALTITAIVLSLGPYPAFLTDRRIPLPYLVLQLVPGPDVLRVPGRFVILGVLGVAVLAAGTIATLADRATRRGAAVVITAALVAAVELVPGSLPKGPGDVPEAYQAIAADPSDEAVLELPLQWSTGSTVVGDSARERTDTVFMYYATAHGHPIVNGSVSRYPDRRLDALLAIPVYRQVLALEDEPGYDDRPSFDARDLAALDIGFVVYHRDRPVPAALRYIEALDLPLLADDGTVVVWRVPS